jgi:hypothetical protein
MQHTKEGLIMNRLYVLAFLFIIFLSGNRIYASRSDLQKEFDSGSESRDTLSESQALYNGRIWRNLFYIVNGNQFLFSNEFLTGSVTLRGKTFKNINIKYDVFKDELLTPLEHGQVLQLNKELVDSFSFNYLNKPYRFIRIKQDTITRSGDYYCVLYTGKTALYLKYIKKIDKLSISGESDTFYQFEKLFFVKNHQFYSISGKSDLLKAMNDKRDQIKLFIKKNKLSVTEKEPENIIPVIRYFDTLSQ